MKNIYDNVKIWPIRIKIMGICVYTFYACFNNDLSDYQLMNTHFYRYNICDFYPNDVREVIDEDDEIEEINDLNVLVFPTKPKLTRYILENRDTNLKNHHNYELFRNIVEENGIKNRYLIFDYDFEKAGELIESYQWETWNYEDVANLKNCIWLLSVYANTLDIPEIRYLFKPESNLSMILNRIKKAESLKFENIGYNLFRGFDQEAVYNDFTTALGIAFLNSYLFTYFVYV